MSRCFLPSGSHFLHAEFGAGILLLLFLLILFFPTSPLLGGVLADRQSAFFISHISTVIFHAFFRRFRHLKPMGADLAVSMYILFYVTEVTSSCYVSYSQNCYVSLR